MRVNAGDPTVRAYPESAGRLADLLESDEPVRIDGRDVYVKNLLIAPVDESDEERRQRIEDLNEVVELLHRHEAGS